MSDERPLLTSQDRKFYKIRKNLCGNLRAGRNTFKSKVNATMADYAHESTVDRLDAECLNLCSRAKNKREKA
jgi:hypothetical protein